MKPNAVILIIFLFIGGCEAASYIGNNVGGKNGAVIGILAWIVMFVLIAVLIAKHNKNKHRRLEEKTDKVIDYAKKSAVYHNHPDSTSDYNAQLKYADEPVERVIPETIAENKIPHQTEEEFFKEYSDEFAKENPTFSEKLKKLSSARELINWIWKNSIRFVPIFISLLFFGGTIFHNPSGVKSFSSQAILVSIKQFILFAAAAGGLYFILRKHMHSSLSNDSIVYKKMIPQEIAKHFGEHSSFDNANGLPQEEIMRFNCFHNKITHISGKHLICGKYKNVDFRCAYERIQRKYEYVDSDGERCTGYEDIFNGYFVSLPFPKNSAHPLGLHSNSRGEITELLRSGSKSRKKTDVNISGTESVDFNTLFTINSVDEENLYYILTPDTMEKLAALYMYVYDTQKNTDNGHYSFMKNMFSGIYVYFEKSRLYIGLNSNFDLLSFKKINPTAEEFRKLNGQISTALTVIERILDFALSLY
ncbi:MAG: DUF3137 domain-containing protein [Porcipelethomonas sp.]